MDPILVASIAVILLLGLMVVGIPVAFSLGISALVGLTLASGINVALSALSMQMFSGPYSFVLTAIPLFVLMAQIVLYTGLGTYLFEAGEAVLGRLPGRLGLASLGSGTAFAAVTGSSIAAVATVGPVSIKEMLERNYSRPFATGLVCAAGGLALIIPPSIMFILYGFIAEVSVAKLFLAGLVPGLLMAVGYAIVIVIWCWIKPNTAPPGRVLTTRQSVVNTMRGFPVMAIGVFILASIYLGITTVTESAAVGVGAAFVFAVAYRKFKWKIVKDAIMDTARTSGFYLMILVGALLFGYMLTRLGLPNAFATWVMSLGLSKWMVLIAVMLLLLLLGMLMDATSILLVVFPIVLVPLRKLGFDPIWLGVTLGIVLETGVITPPFAINIFVLQGVCRPWKVTYAEIAKGVPPFIAVNLGVVAIITIFPILAMWLPNNMG